MKERKGFQMSSTFTSIVQENFSFLVDEFCFQIEMIEEIHVVWKKGNIYIEILHNKYSYEISLLIYRCEDYRLGIVPYSFDELLPCAKLAPLTSSFQASNNERLTMLISKISSLLKDILAKIDVFDHNTFDVLASIRKKNCNEYKNKIDRRYLFEQGNILWKEKEYKQLVLLYQKDIDILTDNERKRYEYALCQLNKNN